MPSAGDFNDSSCLRDVDILYGPRLEVVEILQSRPSDSNQHNFRVWKLVCIAAAANVNATKICARVAATPNLGFEL